MAKKTSSASERTRKMQRKVLEHLAESGNISYSCKRAGISRETYYAWREERPFAHDADLAIEYGKSFVNDLAHTQLIHNIQQGNMQAVRFQLVSCHPDYQPRKPRKPDDEIPQPISEIHIHRADPVKVRAERAAIISTPKQSHDTKANAPDEGGAAKAN